VLAATLTGPVLMCRYRTWTGTRWQDYNLPCPAGAKPTVFVRVEAQPRPDVIVREPMMYPGLPAGFYTHERPVR